jgi:O-antigen/teichoic acid export membrane protein
LESLNNSSPIPNQTRASHQGMRTLIGDVAVQTAGDVAARCIAWFAFVHLARVLEPSAYGLLEMTLSTMVFLTLVVDLGLSRLGIREVARQPERLAELLRAVVSPQLMTAVAVAACGLIAAVAVGLRRDGVLAALLLGYGLSLLLTPFLLVWVFQVRRQVREVALLAILRQAIFAAVVITAVSAPPQIVRVPLAELIGLGLTVAVAHVLLRRGGDCVRIGFSRADVQLVREAWPIGASQVIWALRMFLPIILLGLLAGPVMAGLFGVAHRVFIVVQTPLGFYFTGLLQRLSKIGRDAPEELRRVVRRSAAVSVLPSIALATALTLGAERIIDILFGAPYATSSSPTVLAVLAWVIPILALRGNFRHTLIALDGQREELACSLSGLVLLVALAVPLGSRSGAVGAAWAMVFAELGSTLLTWWRLRRHLHRRQTPSASTLLIDPSGTISQ